MQKDIKYIYKRISLDLKFLNFEYSKSAIILELQVQAFQSIQEILEGSK